MATPLASAHVDSPYRNPIHDTPFQGIMRAKINAASGAPNGDGFYVDSVKLPEQNLLADARAGSASAKAKTGALWRARMKAGSTPLLRWLPTIALGAGALEFGWRIGSLGDRWLQISSDTVGFKPSVGTYLNGSAQYEIEPFGTGQAYEDVPAECAWNATFTFDNTCYVLNMGTVNHGVITNMVIECSQDWATCVGFTDTASWANTYATAWAYAQTQAIGQPYFRSGPNGSGGTKTEAIWVATEAEMAAELYPSKLETYVAQPSVATSGVPNELAGGDHYFFPFSPGPARDSIDAEPGHLPEEWINERLDNTYTPPQFSMPDCIGQTEGFCTTLLELAGWEGELTIGEATLEESNPALAPEAVVVQTYTPGTQLDRGVAITLTLNPNSDNMPLDLPEPLPGPEGETYTQYVTRLQELGYIGTATLEELSENLGDPERGPGDAVTTAPHPGTRIRVGDPVIVRVNPPSWPEPPGAPGGGGGGPSCNCPTNALNLDPITSQSYGDSFPFGVFTMAAGIIGAFNVSPDAPSWTFDLSNVHLTEGDYAVDLQAFDPYMAIIRTLISWVLWIGAIWWLGTRLLGFKAGGDPQEAVDDALPEI